MEIPAQHTSLQADGSTSTILKTALPISLALLVPFLNMVTNTVFLGGLGETELGVAGITSVFYLVFALVGNGLNSGLQSFLSRRAGQNKPLEMGLYFNQAIWISFFLAMLAMLLTYSIAPLFFRMALRSETVERQAMSFLHIRVWGIFFLYLFQLCNAFLVSSRNSRLLKYGFIAEAGFNIFLDYGLIYGHFGMPRMGFNGAAVASVLAEVIAIAVVLAILYARKLPARFGLFSSMRYNPQVAVRYFRQSLPLILQYLLSIVAWLFFYILIEHKGKRPLAISNTMRNLFSLFGVFVWAFASASNALVSNLIGQGRNQEVLRLVRRITWLSLLFTTLLCIPVNLFPGTLLRIFTRDDTFIAEAIPVIRIVSAGVMSMAVATVWLNAVTGTGNTRINLAIELVAILLYGLYIWLVIKVWDLSLVWAWSSELLYWVVLLLLSALYLRSGRWKGKII